MEDRLSQLPDLGFEDEPVEEIKIAMTTFAFKNSEVINLLKERGEIIKNENWDEMEKIDAKINDLKNACLEDLMTPCAVFMTFENEEGVNRAVNFNQTIETDADYEDLGKWFDGEYKHKIEIVKASEPSDIIWENRHITHGIRRQRMVIVVIKTIIMLILAFVLIFACASYSLTLLRKFPDVACDKLPDNDSSANLKKAAIREWGNNHYLEKQGVEVSYAGYVQCFCNERAEAGDPSRMGYGSNY